MEPESKKSCSRCNYERPTRDFQINKQDRRLKTCFKHNKKRALPEQEKDQWNDFIFEIKEWGQPAQTKRINISYTFDLHQLPVSFDLVPKTNGNYIKDYTPLNQAVVQICDLIREAGGHKFRRNANTKNRDVIYYFRCCQDIDFKPKTKESVKRDRYQMDRFPCEGNLKLCINLLDRRLTASLSHMCHKSYTDVQLSPEISAFISTRCSAKTSMEIYHELQLSGIIDADKVAQHQVSYQWYKANISTWRNDPDSFVSATKLLESK